jgi:hypothetical protein
MKKFVFATLLYFTFLTFNDFYSWGEQSKFLGLLFSEPFSINPADLVGMGVIPPWELNHSAGYFPSKLFAVSISPEIFTLGIVVGWGFLFSRRCFRFIFRRKRKTVHEERESVFGQEHVYGSRIVNENGVTTIDI